MSYCRFSDADIYLFSHVDGYICCQVCCLTPKTQRSIFTSGLGDNEHPLFRKAIPPCQSCHGDGCEICCMHHDTNMKTYKEAVAHVKEHIAAGHHVPDYVIPRLEREARIEKYSSSTRHRRNVAMANHLRKIAYGTTDRRRPLAQEFMDIHGDRIMKIKTHLKAIRGRLARLRRNSKDDI